MKPGRSGEGVPPILWSPSPAGVDLRAGEIHVFAFDLDVSAPGVHAFERTLSPDERTRAGKFRFERDRSRFVAGRARMRSILAHYLGAEAGRLRFAYEANGKPGLAGAEAATGLHFNLSASDGVGVLAVQLEEEVGVDVERVRPVPDATGVAGRIFAPEEIAALRAVPPDAIEAAFFSLWTRKEAAVKCLGSGLSFPTRSFAVATGPSEAAERIFLETPGGPQSLWVRSLADPCEGYVAALASAADPVTVRCFRWVPPSRTSADGAEPTGA